MNLVILDGKINSSIEKIIDRRRRAARFMIATPSGERIGVEVRGEASDKLSKDWSIGDKIYVRGHIKAGGYVAADIVRRVDVKQEDDFDKEQLSFCTIPLWQSNFTPLQNAV